MNHIFLIVIAVSGLLVSCVEETKTTKTMLTSNPADTLLEIPNNIVDKSTLHYHPSTSLWTVNDLVFSGYAVSVYEDRTLKEKIGILNGRRQNQAIQWFPDGHYKQVANYHKGKLHGEKKRWSPEPTHVLIAHLHYYLGKVHGEQKQWYSSGELYKKLQVNMGREEGIQQAFRKNGALYANYEARDGRTFGLRKSKLCFGLEDESIQYGD